MKQYAKEFSFTVVASFLIAISTTVFAVTDSTVVRPHSLDRVDVKTQGTITHVTQVTNQKWPTTPCPPTPSNCPDINNPNADPRTCPKICKVSQTTPTGTIINASCPPGYAAYGTFDSQPEYSYSGSSPTEYPRTIQEMNEWKDLGYTCHGAGTEYEKRVPNCTAGTGAEHPKQWDKGQFSDNFPSGYERVVYFSSYPFQRCTTLGSSCSEGFIIDCSVSGEWYWRYYFQFVTCTRAPGNYATGRYIPGSIACARIQQTWQ